MKFLKLDMADEDSPIQTVVEATDMPTLLSAEHRKYLDDDRLSPCHGVDINDCVGYDENSIQWSPGDGGQYTIAIYAPDTRLGAATIGEYLSDYE